MSKYSAWVKPSLSTFSREMSQEAADISKEFYSQLYETAKVVNLNHEDIIGMQRGMGDIPSVEMLLEDAIEDPENWRFAKEHQQVGGLIERLLDNRPVDMPIVVGGTRGGYTALSGRHRLVYSVALDIPVKVLLVDGEEFNLADWGSRKKAEGSMQNFNVSVQVLASKFKDFQKAPVLFRIRTVDIPMEMDGKPDVIPGGAEYDVIAFEEGKYYVTNQAYKPGVPQLVPWMAAKKISAGATNGDFSVKVETQFYSDAEVPASYSAMVKKELEKVASKNPGAYVSIGIDGHADESRHSQGFSLPTWTLKDGAVKTDHQPWSVKLQNWSVNVNYKSISSETVSDLKQLANALSSLFK